jgi:hypothetical protein
VTRAGLAIAALIALRAEDATAGSCGGSSGSDSSSSSDSGGSSSSIPAIPACSDATDIVGYRRCTEFGAWGANLRKPLVQIELGTAMRTFASPTGERWGSLEHDSESFSFRTVGASESARPFDTALVTTLRIALGGRYGSFLALEGELGGLVEQTGGRVEMMTSGLLGTPSIEQTHAIVVSGLAVAGAGGSIGRLRLGAEVAGGVRDVAYLYESHYLACEQSETLSITTGVLEARARAGVWLSPFVSVGVTAGASLLDRGAWVGGLSVGVVTQAFGGTR